MSTRRLKRKLRHIFQIEHGAGGLWLVTGAIIAVAAGVVAVAEYVR